MQVRSLATHAASHALAHARTWPAWDVQHTPAKPPRPNTSTSFCTPHLSAQHHTTAHSSFSGQQQPTTHTDNTLHTSTHLITHTRTLTRSSAAPQIQQQQQPSQQSMQHAAVQASFWHSEQQPDSSAAQRSPGSTVHAKSNARHTTHDVRDARYRSQIGRAAAQQHAGTPTCIMPHLPKHALTRTRRIC